MPKKRAILLVTWFGRHANIIMTLLAFLVVIVGVWSLYLYAELRNTRSSLTGIEIARIVEERAEGTNRVRSCRESIQLVASANILITTMRADLLSRAEANEAVARTSSEPSIRRLRLDQARMARRNASQLIAFPPRNKAFCDELERVLRAELELKYGDKLTQLEREQEEEEPDAQESR